MTLSPQTFFANNFRTPGFMSAATFGAKGDGVTDDRIAIQAAIDAAVALGGCTIYFPPGTYMVSRAGAHFYCLNISGNNVRFQGAYRGGSVIQQVAGLPAVSVSCVFGDSITNFHAEMMEFNGNWGNALTTVASTSNNQLLPGSGGPATINVLDTTGFPASGTFTAVLPDRFGQVVTYTGKTATSFTGCTGGTGTLLTGQNVGYVDGQAGINQGDQTGDPQNHGCMMRGCNNLLFRDCRFVQNYGDGIWIGESATTPSIGQETRVLDCDFFMVARNGISIGNSTNDVLVQNSRFVANFQVCFDSEPGGLVQNVKIDNNDMFGWWDQSRAAGQFNGVINMQGAFPAAPLVGLHITNNFVSGSIGIEFAQGVVITGNEVTQDFFGDATSAIYCAIYEDSFIINNNFVYSRTSTTAGAVLRLGAIAVTFFAGGSQQNQLPTNGIISGNQVKVRNARDGIYINTPGATGQLVTGTGSTITDTTLIDTTSTWTVNQWAGYRVQVGAAFAEILSNTSNGAGLGGTLTLRRQAGGTSNAWTDYLGKAYYTPTAPASYTIFGQSGMVVVDNNQIDCANDGWGAGGYGIYCTNSTNGLTIPSGRIRLTRNQISNANPSAIKIVRSPSQPYTFLELTNNYAYDTQLVPTCITNIDMDLPFNITKFVMRDNQVEGAIAAHNVTSGVWIVNDGSPQQWAGWSSPNGVIAASIGSIFQRLDPGGAAALWVKQSDDSLNTGWVRLTQPTTVGWTIDSGSGIGIPQNTTEWINVIAAAGLTGLVSVPDALWLCQEAAGNLADSIGIFTMTATGANLRYQQTVPAWQSKGVGFPVNVFQGWANTDASLPDLLVANATMCCYAEITNPLNQSSLLNMGTGAGTTSYIGTDGTGKPRAASGAVGATGTLATTGAVSPFVIQSNRTGLACTGLTSHDKLSPAFSVGVTGKQIQFGNPAAAGVNKTPAANIVYGWAWLTTTPTAAQIKLILQVLGWIIDWS
jgi:hypothetical protein